MPQTQFDLLTANWQQTCSGKLIFDPKGFELPYCYCGIITSPSEFSSLVIEMGNLDVATLVTVPAETLVERNGFYCYFHVLPKAS